MSTFRFMAAAIALSACAVLTPAKAQTPPPDLVYSRIKPCRVFDTTKTQKIPANSAKSFLMSGAGDYAAQGGTAGGCGVPASAQAVSLNITAINGAAAGSLTAMAYAQTTSAATIRFPVAAPETIGGFVDLLQNKITLRTTNTVNAIGDVTGYWAPQIWAVVHGDGTIASGSRIVRVTKAAKGIYYLEFDREISSCASVVSDQSGQAYNGFYSPVPSNTLQVFLYFHETGGAADRTFHVAITC